MEFEKEKEEQLHDERYDRTIRALTAEVALKVMKSKVAITPLNGINTEFMKNIILDGANVTIFDDSIVNEHDVETNFMISPHDLNKNKGEVLKAKFNEMNPYSKIDCRPLLKVQEVYKEVVEQNGTLLNEFDVLAVSTTSFEAMILWDKIATKLNKPLYILNCCGFYGFTWMNVGRDFTFISVKPKTEVYNFVDGEYKKTEAEEKNEFEDVTLSCESLENCLIPSKKNKTTIYYAINMMYQAEKQGLIYDPYNPNEEVLEKIVQIGKDIYQQNNLKSNETTEETLRYLKSP